MSWLRRLLFWVDWHVVMKKKPPETFEELRSEIARELALPLRLLRWTLAVFGIWIVIRVIGWLVWLVG